MSKTKISFSRDEYVAQLKTMKRGDGKGVRGNVHRKMKRPITRPTDGDILKERGGRERQLRYGTEGTENEIYGRGQRTRKRGREWTTSVQLASAHQGMRRSMMEMKSGNGSERKA